jgi:type IV secretory pathway TrbD component
MQSGVESRPESYVEAHVIHASLFRPVLFAGAEPPVVMLEMATAFALIFGIGLHAATVALAVFYVTVVHSLMVRVAQQDPQMSALYIRSLSARDFYLPHSASLKARSKVFVSIPRRA